MDELRTGSRAERRALARRIVKASPGLIEKIMEEDGVERGRAKQLAVRYIATGLGAQARSAVTGVPA